jgi:flagellar assembly protein FliH
MRAARPATFQVLRQSAPPSWLEPSSPSDPRPAFEAAATPDPIDARAREIEAMIDAARTQATAEGRARGEAEGRARWVASIAELRSLAAELAGQQGRLLASLEDLILELTVTIAGVLLERELAEDPRLVARLVEQAVALCGEEESLEVRVPPALHARLGDALAGIASERTLQLRADPAIAAGCVVETRLARVDATLAGRLRTVLEGLRRAPEEEAP